MPLPAPITTYLNSVDFKAMSAFPRVQALSDTQSLLFVNRAHSKVVSLGPFPLASSLDDTTGNVDPVTGLTQREQFVEDMQLATFLIAERMALANPITAMDAAGINLESAGNSRLSRAPGGGNQGRTAATNLVPAEALEIFQRWRTIDAELFKPQRQNLFQPPKGQNAVEPDELVFVVEDTEDLSQSLYDRNYPGANSPSPIHGD